MVEAGPGQLLESTQFHHRRAVVVGQRGRVVMEQGVGLQRELVAGQVLRLQGDGLFEIGLGLLQVLSRQCEHQVDIDIVETGLACRFEGTQSLLPVVDTAQRFEMPVVEALYADGQAIDAGLAVSAEMGFVGAVGVGFQRDLAGRMDRQTGAQAAEQPVNGFGRKQRWRAAAEKDAVDAAAPDQRQFVVQVLEQGIDIGLWVAVLVDMGIEIAIGALACAPGQVHVQRQWGQGGQAQAAFRCSRCTSSRNAWPRWLRRFFSAGSSSALVQP